RRGHNEKEELATRRTNPSAQLARCLQQRSLPHLLRRRGQPPTFALPARLSTSCTTVALSRPSRAETLGARFQLDMQLTSEKTWHDDGHPDRRVQRDGVSPRGSPSRGRARRACRRARRRTERFDI